MLPRASASGTQGQAGHRQAGADRVAGAQERSEVRSVLRPQRGRDEVIPAWMAAVTPLAGQVLAGPDPDLRAAHRSCGAVHRETGFSVAHRHGASRRTGAITGYEGLLPG